jgi:hypothetical protein
MPPLTRAASAIFVTSRAHACTTRCEARRRAQLGSFALCGSREDDRIPDAQLVVHRDIARRQHGFGGSLDHETYRANSASITGFAARSDLRFKGEELGGLAAVRGVDGLRLCPPPGWHSYNWKDFRRIATRYDGGRATMLQSRAGSPI